MYVIEFDEGWEGYFEKLDRSVQLRLLKKIWKLKSALPARHLRHGADFFVVEAGQYWICFKTDEVRRVRQMFFAGTHKDYEKWLREKA